MGNVVRLSNFAQANLDKFKDLYIQRFQNLADEGAFPSDAVELCKSHNDAEWLEFAICYGVSYLKQDK